MSIDSFQPSDTESNFKGNPCFPEINMLHLHWCQIWAIPQVKIYRITQFSPECHLVHPQIKEAASSRRSKPLLCKDNILFFIEGEIIWSRFRKGSEESIEGPSIPEDVVEPLPSACQTCSSAGHLSSESKQQQQHCRKLQHVTFPSTISVALQKWTKRNRTRRKLKHQHMKQFALPRFRQAGAPSKLGFPSQTSPNSTPNLRVWSRNCSQIQEAREIQCPAVSYPPRCGETMIISMLLRRREGLSKEWRKWQRRKPYLMLCTFWVLSTITTEALRYACSYMIYCGITIWREMFLKWFGGEHGVCLNHLN